MDKTTESFLCNGCQKELIQDTGYPARYGLVLSSKDFNRNSSHTQLAVVVRPLIRKPAHFCGFGCLSQWIDKKGVQG